MLWKCCSKPEGLLCCKSQSPYICTELFICRCMHESTHHILRGLIPVRFSDRGDAQRGENCWLLFCVWWAQWSNVNHDCRLSIFPARKNRACERVGLVVHVHVFCRSRTTMSGDWLPVMDAGPADTKYLAHVLEARPKSLLLLLRRTVRSSASLLLSGCWLH